MNVKNIPNIITLLRIVMAISMLFTEVFSISFYILYILCGLSDVADGYIARKYNLSTKFGNKFDTIADYIFVIACAIKIIPTVLFKPYQIIWISIIFVVKTFCMIKNKGISHHFLNKITGILLFILCPFLKDIVIVVLCLISSISIVLDIYKIY